MLVSVTIAAGADIDDVAAALGANGFTVTDKLTEIGIINGTCNDPESLKDIDGVFTVEVLDDVQTQ